jgi:hypothetical protein
MFFNILSLDIFESKYIAAGYFDILSKPLETYIIIRITIAEGGDTLNRNINTGKHVIRCKGGSLPVVRLFI